MRLTAFASLILFLSSTLLFADQKKESWPFCYKIQPEAQCYEQVSPNPSHLPKKLEFSKFCFSKNPHLYMGEDHHWLENEPMSAKVTGRVDGVQQEWMMPLSGVSSQDFPDCYGWYHDIDCHSTYSFQMSWGKLPMFNYVQKEGCQKVPFKGWDDDTGEYEYESDVCVTDIWDYAGLALELYESKRPPVARIIVHGGTKNLGTETFYDVNVNYDLCGKAANSSN